MNKLIYDIGMHTGQDTLFYLKSGYNVLAIEADPILVEKANLKFKKFIDSGQLTILNIGIAESEGVLPFYRNLRLTEWSSFDKTMGSRSGQYEVIDIPCTSTKKLFEQYGIPYYLKVDIEGFDYLCINDLPSDGRGPQYVSCEAQNLSLLETLKSKGYNKFKMINQGDNHRPINIWKEKLPFFTRYQIIKNGIIIRLQDIIPIRKYKYRSSGPFGENTKGEWMSFEETKNLYESFYNNGNPINNYSWFDFHAKY